MTSSFFNWTAGMGFSVEADSTLGEIDLAYNSGEMSTVTATLYPDANMDSLTALQSWSIDVPVQSTQILKLLAGSTPVTLSEGVTYWLLLNTQQWRRNLAQRFAGDLRPGLYQRRLQFRHVFRSSGGSPGSGRGRNA